MSTRPDKALSIVIVNYNYEKYIDTAIGSVLPHIGDDVELVVVDDCSTDSSWSLISKYGDEVKKVRHAVNAGHGGAKNTGFAASSGRMVMFLDSDDFILPGGVQAILENEETGVSLYQYRLTLCDQDGVFGDLYPPEQVELSQGDVSKQIRELGRAETVVTSGLVYSRAALERVMPMPAEEFRQGGDGYLVAVTPLFGEVRAFGAPLSGYRKHQSNHSSFEHNLFQRAQWCVSHDQARYRAIVRHAEALALPVAADLGQKDILHVEQTMALLLLGDGASAEERKRVGRLGIAIAKQRSGFKMRTANALFWMTTGWGPKAVAKRLFVWKVSAASRPAPLRWAARKLRQAGVMVR